MAEEVINFDETEVEPIVADPGYRDVIYFDEAEVEPILAASGYNGVIYFDESEVEPIIVNAAPPGGAEALQSRSVSAYEAVTAPPALEEQPESGQPARNHVFDPVQITGYRSSVATRAQSEDLARDFAFDPVHITGYRNVLDFDPVHNTGQVPRSGPSAVEATTGLTRLHRDLVNRARVPVDPMPAWDTGDIVKTELERKLSSQGISSTLAAYKDRWVRAHRKVIRAAAQDSGVPEWILGGIAWTEVAGDPAWTDSLGRIVSDPEYISFGPVQMELRRAEEELGYEVGHTSRIQQSILINTLLDPQHNVFLVSSHMNRLKNVDAPAKPWTELSEEDIRVAVTRYNRGPELTRDEILHTNKKTSYGDAVLNRRTRTEALLKDP